MNLHAVRRRNPWCTADEFVAAPERSRAALERLDNVRWIRSYVVEDSECLGSVGVYLADGPDAIRSHGAVAVVPVTETVKVAETVVAGPDPV